VILGASKANGGFVCHSAGAGTSRVMFWMLVKVPLEPLISTFRRHQICVMRLRTHLLNHGADLRGATAGWGTLILTTHLHPRCASWLKRCMQRTIRAVAARCWRITHGGQAVYFARPTPRRSNPARRRASRFSGATDTRRLAVGGQPGVGGTAQPALVARKWYQ
jgi:hypothetical protein